MPSHAGCGWTAQTPAEHAQRDRIIDEQHAFAGIGGAGEHLDTAICNVAKPQVVDVLPEERLPRTIDRSCLAGTTAGASIAVSIDHGSRIGTPPDGLLRQYARRDRHLRSHPLPAHRRGPQAGAATRHEPAGTRWSSNPRRGRNSLPARVASRLPDSPPYSVPPDDPASLLQSAVHPDDLAAHRADTRVRGKPMQCRRNRSRRQFDRVVQEQHRIRGRAMKRGVASTDMANIGVEVHHPGAMHIAADMSRLIAGPGIDQHQFDVAGVPVREAPPAPSVFVETGRARPG